VYHLQKQFDMSGFRFTVCLFFLLFTVSMQAIAQEETEVYEGMTWCLNKSAALDSAASQGKQVFFVWGRTSCMNTIYVRQRLGREPLKSIVDESYILWFADYEKYKRNSPEVSDYLSKLPGSVVFPAICVIDTVDAEIPYGLQTGPRTVSELQELMLRYVGNGYVAETVSAVNVYVSGSCLVIDNEIPNEIVRIFSMTGGLVDCYRKGESHAMRDLSAYPKGVLIVAGSTGWCRKVVN
jgi:hypothetical protein